MCNSLLVIKVGHAYNKETNCTLCSSVGNTLTIKEERYDPSMKQVTQCHYALRKTSLGRAALQEHI